MSRDQQPPALAVVSHDSVADLRLSLPGIAAASEQLGSPLVIVDNASGSETIAFLEAWRRRAPSMTLVRLSVNRGFAAATNRAFARVPGSDVLLLNPDVELPGANPVRALASYMDRHPGVAVAAPRLVDGAGALQPSARRPASLAAMLGSLPAARSIPALRGTYERYLAPSSADQPVAVGWVIGAAMLIRRAAFEQVGGFDERFFLYMEDADFCRRLYRAGWEVHYLPGIRFRHGYARASSAAGATVIGSPARRRHFASLARYWRKHPRALVGGER